MADETSTMSNEDRLIYMANQIARNFGTLGHDQAAKAVADHIASFWDPRMRATIFALHERGDARIGDIAGSAVAMLRDVGTPSPQTRATEFNGVDEAGHSDAG
jgi:formate dehydrogenase subunit delta